MGNTQREFIIKIILSNTQSAAFQRANVYANKKSGKGREEFVKEFHAKLRSLEQIYSKKILKTEHIKTIKKFQSELSKKFPRVLARGKMRFGVAQKAVNLYLKFLWCLGYIPHEPPHCPIDGKVLTKVGSDEKWTKLDDVKKYEKIIDAIRAKAEEKNQTIAEWEWDLWQNSH